MFDLPWVSGQYLIRSNGFSKTLIPNLFEISSFVLILEILVISAFLKILDSIRSTLTILPSTIIEFSCTGNEYSVDFNKLLIFLYIAFQLSLVQGKNFQI